MSVKRILISLSLAGILLIGGTSSAFADGANVVTLGANLTDSQKQTVLKYFDVTENEVVILEVNNEEERKYLEGVAPEAQLGTKTFSCSYVEPTSAGSGIKVKTVNITYVTSNMIASTLATCGITDANVIAMSPIPVSGTGALTGVMKAFEDATGEKLPEEKKEIASEELVVTGDIATEVGADKATGIVNDIKTEIIKENTKDTVQIAETIVNVTNNYNVNLTDTQKKDLESLMKKIADQEYDYSQIKDTLENIGDTITENLEVAGESIDKGLWEDIKSTVSGWFESIGDFFTGVGSDIEEDLGILGETNDELLGEDVVVDATEDEAVDNVENGQVSEEGENQVEEKGFFEKIWDWFTGLFSSDDVQNSDGDVEIPDTENLEDKTTEGEEDKNIDSENESDIEDTDNIIGGGDTPEQEEVETDKTTEEIESPQTEEGDNSEDTNSDENIEEDNTSSNEGDINTQTESEESKEDI